MATALTQFTAVGRRKNAVARVYLRPNGSGKVTVNKRDMTAYFPTKWRQTAITSPFTVNFYPSEDGLTPKAGAAPLLTSLRHRSSRNSGSGPKSPAGRTSTSLWIVRCAAPATS